MGDLLEIQNQIEKLQKQAAEIKGRECGRGLAPRWLAALIAQGKAEEDFAIKR